MEKLSSEEKSKIISGCGPIFLSFLIATSIWIADILSNTEPKVVTPPQDLIIKQRLDKNIRYIEELKTKPLSEVDSLRKIQALDRNQRFVLLKDWLWDERDNLDELNLLKDSILCSDHVLWNLNKNTDKNDNDQT